MSQHIKKCQGYKQFTNEVDRDNNNSTEENVVVCLPDFSNPNKIISQKNINKTILNTFKENTNNFNAGTSKIKIFFDTITEQNQTQLDSALALAIFMSNCPFNLVENKYFNNFLKLMRPAYKIPSRHAISKTLLDFEYIKVKNIINNKFNNLKDFTLISDGWTNIRGESIINFIIMTPEPIFFKSIDTGSCAHTGEYIASELIKVIEEIGCQKFISLVTDNAKNMKKAWSLVKAKYNYIECFGCAAHGLNLLIKDLCQIPFIEKIIKKTKQIIKYMKFYGILLATFKERQILKGYKSSLKIRSPTRWGGFVIMLQSVVKNKEVLQEIAISSLFTNKQRRLIILGKEGYWDKLESVLTFLEFIYKKIIFVESDSAVLSDVPEIIWDIKDKLNSSTFIFNENDLKSVKMHIKKRKKFCCREYHYATNLLDPRYYGVKLTDRELTAALNIINIISGQINCDIGKIMGNLAEYRSKQGFYKGTGIWESSIHTKPLIWWKGLCTNQPLCQVAVRCL
ncbi:uncharacterized protein LOC135924008 [Gordionus sp. m RMFG-2023]|uniref:uncharacterized protein LOC135924008 n=1 Tax=Gordionus sp. m RMFG-2023 TaxID=3053472 RepID=UPI0031FC04AF